ncbi:unnamed protein product [Lasius platythorax]|uniref:Uncharacterized protein n=1 Tax=Lasius platythorax TaxID=488582 RepID=A0AAV2MZJ3_9HYME
MSWYGALGPAEGDLVSAASLADWITRRVRNACDVSTPRLGAPRDRPGVYWWNDTIAACRKASISARRQLTRCKSTDAEILAKKQR